MVVSILRSCCTMLHSFFRSHQVLTLGNARLHIGETKTQHPQFETFLYSVCVCKQRSQTNLYIQLIIDIYIYVYYIHISISYYLLVNYI